MSETSKHEKDSPQHEHAHTQHGHAKESLVAAKMPSVATPVEAAVTNDGTELLIVEDTTLTPAQNLTTNQLMRLYESLCGPRPGEYWPQALLDAAGTFNRPPFPSQNGGR
jgi:hypothetical protein